MNPSRKIVFPVVSLFFILICFVQHPGHIVAQSRSVEEQGPQLIWRRALGGKIHGYPAQGPDGDIYFIAEDRALHSINVKTGSLNWKFRPGGRLGEILLVSPEGTVFIEAGQNQIFAVSPRGKKRWRYKFNSPRQFWPAVGPNGQLALVDSQGTVSIISRLGEETGKIDNIPQILTHPVYDSAGRLWLAFQGGRIGLLNQRGEVLTNIRVPYQVSSLSMDLAGGLWVGGRNGAVELYYLDNHQARKDYQIQMHAGVEAIFTAGEEKVSAVLQGGLVVNFTRNGRGKMEQKIEMSRGFPVQVNDGSIIYSPLDGGIRIVDPRSPGYFILSSIRFSPPLVSREGYIISGGDDWIVYAWEGSRMSRGWTQFRSSALRQGGLTYSSWLWSREEARKDPQFLIRESMARSKDISEPVKLLEELESYPNDQDRLRAMPWVDFLFIDLMSVSMNAQGKVNENHFQSHVTVRHRAYSLIARDENFRMRERLIQQLGKEQDHAVLSAGINALGRIGVDWDGASTRFLGNKINISTESDEALVLDVMEALVHIIQYNGGFTDVAGFRIFQEAGKRRLSPKNRRKLNKLVTRLKKLT